MIQPPARLTNPAIGRPGKTSIPLFPIGITTLALLLATLPYLVNWLATPPGLVFVGLLSNPLDGFSYLAKMDQGVRGNWLFHLPATPESHAGAPLFLYYLALGHLAALTGLSTVAVYHLARLAGGVALGLTAWSFFGRTLAAPTPRRFAFTLFMLGEGFGWLTALFGHLPVDLLVPEATAFHSLFANPHFPLATAALLVAMPAIVDAIAGGAGNRRLLAQSAAFLVAVLLQPFLIVPAAVVAATWWLARALHGDRTPLLLSARRLFLLLGPAGAAAIVMAASLYLDPVLRRWTAQNVTPSPPPWDYLLGFGWPAFAVLGLALARARGERSERGERGNSFLAVWLLVGGALLYAPFGLQRRVVEGIQAPLVGLATAWLFGSVVPNVSTAGLRRALVGAALGLSLFGGLFFILLMTLGGLAQPDPLFIQRDELAALAWLRQSTRPDDVVLAAPTTGALIPAFAGNRVVYGHPFETVDAAARRAAATAFFARSAASADDAALLQRERVAYVFFGPRERALGGLDPASLPGVVPAFHNGTVTIYRVH